MGHSISGRTPGPPSLRQSGLDRGIPSSASNHRAAQGVSARRRGTVAVEFAIVSIPLFTFIFGIIEFGRALMAIHAMEEAARAGCRKAIVREAKEQDVKSEVASLLESVAIDKFEVSIEPADIDNAPRWQPISVTVKAKFKDMSLFSGPLFLEDAALSASCTLAKEWWIED